MANRPQNPSQPNYDGYHMPGERPGEAPTDADLPRLVAQARGGGPREPRGGPPQRGSALGSVLFYVGLAVVALAVFAGAFLAGSSPDALIRARIVDAVKAQTGRDLVIQGGTSFTFYPSLGVVMRDVTLSPPPGMTGTPTARIGSLEASVGVMALIKRQIEVERLVVRDGVFDLRVDKQGRRSWQFAALADDARPTRYAQARTAGVANDATRTLPAEAKEFLKNAEDERARSAGTGGADGGLSRLRDLALGDVRLENGTITYTDERTARSQRITAINARLATRSLESPLEVAGNLVVEGQRVDFDGRLTALKQLMAEQPAKLAFNAAAQPVKASFDGTVHVKEVVDLAGAFAMSAASARELGAWAGIALPPSEGFGPLAIKGNLRAAGKSLAFSDATFELDGATATGTLSVESRPARPLIRGNLKLSALDLNKYMADGAPAATGKKAEAPRSPSQAAPSKAATNAPQSIEDLLKHAPAAPGAGPAVKGYERRAGWSEEPIRLAALGLADVDAALSVGSIAARDLKIGASRLRIVLQALNLKTTIEDMALYDGHARGLVTIDASAANPRVTASLSADGLAAKPLLADAADIDWLSGTAKLTLALAGQGQTEKQIVDSLDGTAGFNFANGAVAGFNVPQILRGISQGKLGGFDRVPTEKTDFSELSASFTVKDGVASNQDLQMASPLLRVTGGGQILLGARQIDYTARPKVVGSLAGQGGGLNLTGLEVPVRIHGSWDAPRYTPDIEGALNSAPVQQIIKDPNKAIEAAKDIGRKLGGKKAGDLLRDLLGGN